MSLSTILGILLLLYAAFVIYRGRLTSGDDYGNTSTISRSKNPVQFWISTIIMLAVAAALILNIVHF